MNPNVSTIIKVGKELQEVEDEISRLKRISEKLKSEENPTELVVAHYPQRCSTIKLQIRLTKNEALIILDNRISPMHTKRDFLIKQLEAIAP